VVRFYAASDYRRSPDAPPEPGCTARQVIGRIDIPQCCDKRYAPAGKVAHGVVKRMRARPAHIPEGTGNVRPPPESYQPKPTVNGGTENRIVIPEDAESLGNVCTGDAWNIRADDDRGPHRRSIHQSLHALAQIAATLGGTDSPSGPDAASDAGIRGHGENGLPAWIVSHTRQKYRGGMPAEPH
jgi:hypothetical protein